MGIGTSFESGRIGQKLQKWKLIGRCKLSAVAQLIGLYETWHIGPFHKYLTLLKSPASLDFIAGVHVSWISKLITYHVLFQEPKCAKCRE